MNGVVRLGVAFAVSVALLIGLITSLVLALRSVLRFSFGTRAALKALSGGSPRTYRASMRALRRIWSGPWLQWVLPEAHRTGWALIECYGLFWEGAFDRALARVEPLVAQKDASIWPLTVLLKVECLLFDDRVVDARQVLVAHRRDLWAVPSRANEGADLEMVEALLRFYEGALDESGSLLAEFVASAGACSPNVRLAHFHLAAIAFRQGRSQETVRSHLLTAAYRGGSLFPASWAEQAHAELFPGVPPISRETALAKAGPPMLQARVATSGAPLVSLARNLAAGLGLLRFRAGSLERLVFSHEQWVLLALFNVACVGLARSVDYSPGATLFDLGAFAAATPILWLGFAASLAVWGLRPANAGLRVAVAFYSALPVPLVLHLSLTQQSSRKISGGVAVVHEIAALWALALFVFLAKRLTDRTGVARLAAAGTFFALAWLWPMRFVGRYPIWFSPHPRSVEATDTEPEGVAALAFAQADRLNAAEAALRPERPGVEDLYFVGFAPWGREDVFLREARSAQHLFDDRFDTRGHSLVLANDLSVREALPMASEIGLAHALRAVGRQMNREEDVLFLLATSHGSSAGLAVEAPGREGAFTDGELTPLELRRFLDEAGIKWRVLMVSGCKSGVFVDPLKNENTLVATASAGDRVSFGCGNGHAFTEFGRAVFAEQLVHERSFPVAFARAADSIRAREEREGRPPSHPQLWVGAAIDAKLRSLETRVGDALTELAIDPIEEGDAGQTAAP
jgi:hypothetical protein